MTASRDPDRLIRTFLDEGMTELPTRVYDAVRSDIENTRQRVVFGPWREPHMNSFTRFALAAVAVVVIAVVGVSLFPRLAITGPGGTPTAAVTPSPLLATLTPSPLPATPTPSPLPSITGTRVFVGDLYPPGTYYFDDQDLIGVRRISFTVPGGGWEYTGSILDNWGKPGTVLVKIGLVDRIYTDICQWRDKLVDVASEAELLDALASQVGTFTATPEEITFAGFPALRIARTTTVHDASLCSDGKLHYWPDPGSNEDQTGLFGQDPTTETMYVVDVHGTRVVIVARQRADVLSKYLNEMETLVGSIHIDP